jgi:hypothetical protein
LTEVYGPQAEGDKAIFMQEVRELKQVASNRWLLLGDFNLIYRASDKSKGQVNNRIMNSCQLLLDEIEMKKIHLVK